MPYNCTFSCSRRSREYDNFLFHIFLFFVVKFPLLGWCSRSTLGRKLPQILLGWCSEAVPGRKRHLFLRRMGYLPPAGQKNAPNPARKVLQRHSRQKNGAESARNGIPPACRLPGKHKKRGRSKTSLLKLLAYLKLSLYDSTHWASVSASTAISTHVSVNFVNVAC